MKYLCKQCGTENSNDARYCRKCGMPMKYVDLENNLSEEDPRNKNPGWFKACLFVGIFAVLYGVMAIITHTSYIYSIDYEGNGHLDYVTIVHQDALGLIHSTGSSMEAGTPLSVIEDQAYTKGMTSYDIGAFGLIVLGGLVVSGGLIVRKRQNARK